MKNFLYLLGFVLGGFLIYKLIERFTGSSVASSAGGGSRFGVTPTRQVAQLPGRVITPNNSTNNAAAIVGATAGALKALPSIVKDFSQLFKKPETIYPASDPNNFDFSNLMFSGVTNDPLSWSFNSSTPAVDYTASPTTEPSFDWNSSGETLWA